MALFIKGSTIFSRSGRNPKTGCGIVVALTVDGIDASGAISQVISAIALFLKEDSAMLKGARVIKNRQLTEQFNYLESYVYDDIYRASRIKS